MDFTEVELRPLVRETKLTGQERIIIAAPSEESGIEAAKKLKEALDKVADSVELLNDPGGEVIKEATGPVFVIGNLANSQCACALYYLFLSLTDRWYPGPAGYEVRTLMNPLGTGHNIIHLGYSDDAGLEAGASILLGKVADPLPFLSEVHAVRFPMPAYEVEAIRKGSMEIADYAMIKSEIASGKCYLAYLSKDEELIEESSKFWEAMTRYGVRPYDHLIKDLHLRITRAMSLFRLMEQTGLVKDELRRAFLEFFFDFARSHQGISYLKGPVYQADGYPRQNHGMNPALGFIFAADYFNRHHPELEEPYQWKKVAEGVFEPYNDGSWKPMCDGLCHGWWTSQPVMLDYALFEPEHRYLKSGGARKAADCTMLVLNNQGWLPSSGDGNLVRAFAGQPLRVAAAWYNDGRYRYVHELAPEYRRHHLMAYLQRTFCTDVEPEVPEDFTGLQITAMDPLIYHMFDKNPELAAIRADRPPDAPIEKCFDKLKFRTGWDVNDDCLLVDGLGHFSHAYADAMEIVEYTRYGLSFIVSEHGPKNPEPESHSMVTITRDGEVGLIPGYAEILKAEYGEDGNGYVGMRLKDFAGADWVRELHFRKGVGVVIHDTITATKAGEYAIESHLRVPGYATLEGNTFISQRTSPTVGDVEFRISGCSSDDATFRIDTCDMSMWHRNPIGEGTPAPEVDRVLAWERRYNLKDRVISIFRGRVATALQPGESVSFTQLAQAIGPDDAEFSIVSEDGIITLSGNGQSWKLPVSHFGKRLAADSGTPDVKLPELNPIGVASFESPISCMASVGEEQLLCGMEDGTLALLSKSGETVWTAKLEGKVHDASGLVTGGKAMYFAGHGDTGLTALDEDGKVAWSKQLVRMPTSCQHWELPETSAVQVKAYGGENPFVAVGCGDLQLRVFSIEGEQTGNLLYQNGVPGRVNVLDVDGDGEPEIVAGGEISSSEATCRILTPEAKLKAQLKVEGWTSKMTAWTHEVCDGRYLMACGASRARNLHVYELRAGGTDDAVHVLEKKLGGAVRGVGLYSSDGFVVAGSTMGFVVAYNFDGSVRWQQLMDHDVDGLAALKDSILVWDSKGNCCQLSRDGERMAEAALSEPVLAAHIEREANTVYLAKGSKVLCVSL